MNFIMGIGKFHYQRGVTVKAASEWWLWAGHSSSFEDHLRLFHPDQNLAADTLVIQIFKHTRNGPDGKKVHTH